MHSSSIALRFGAFRALPAFTLVVAGSLAGAQSVDSSLFQAVEWRELGPATFGGRIIDLAVPETDPFTIYAATATGGLFRTRNHATTWECLFQHEGTISLGDVALDPQDPDTIWLGTGEANNQRSSYWGDGIYKSSDGGKTWSNMGLRDSHHIGRIVVDPRDSDVVYVAALGHLYSSNAERGLYRTRDGGRTWDRVLDLGPEVGVVDVVLDPSEPDRVYAASYERLRRAWHFDGAGEGSAIHRSLDGGETWTRLEGGLPTGEIGRIGLDVSRQNSKVLYATVSNQNPQPEPEPEEGERPRLGVRAVPVEGGGLEVQSVTEDSAAARAELKAGDVLLRAGEQELSGLADLVAALEAAGDTLALSLRRGEESLDVVVTLRGDPPRRRRGGGQIGGEIYRSEDGGDTWVKQNENPIGGSPAYYYGQIRVDPNDDQTLYVLSVPVYVSRDGGKTWNQGNLAGSVHVDHHALWIDPADSRHLLLGNDGGMHVSYDAGETWVHLNNLPIAQFYAIQVDMRRPYHVYGGTQDNGTWMGPSRSRSPRGVSSSTWTNIGGGDGFQIGVDPLDPDIVYVESQFGALQRVDLKTGSSTSIRPPASVEGERDRYNWMSPLLISPHSPMTIYFGGNKLFKSYDRGDHWHVISPDLSTQDADKIAGNVPHCTITTIDESPLQPDRLLVGTDDGNVQWSDDGGKNWTNLAGVIHGVPPRRWVSRVEFSHHDADTAYVSFTGYREDDFAPYLFRTRDGGESWESISSDLPRGGINVVREDPRNPELLYVGAELGCWATLDGGTHWFELGRGLPSLAVHDLVVHPRDRELVAGTHGRGMWILDIAPLQGLNAPLLQESAVLLDPPETVRWRTIFRQGDGFSGDFGYRAPNPEAGVALYYHLGADQAEDTVALTIRNAAGEVVQHFEELSVSKGLHRVQWALDRRPEEAGDGETQTRRRFRGRAMVPPGRYVAELTVGEESFSTSIDVVDDPLEALRNPSETTRLYDD